MDLEKAFVRVDRYALWQVLRLYGVGGKLLKAVKSFYVDRNEKLERLVVEFGRVCRRRKSKVNVSKSKVMRSARDGVVGGMNIMIDCEVLEEVAVFKYLGSLVTAVWGVKAEDSFRGE